MRHARSVRRVALMLDLDWPYERHLGVFHGTQRYAQESGRWQCFVDESVPGTLREARGLPYDGVIARATPELAAEAKRRRLPVINTWFDSPAHDLPCVAPDFAAIGRVAAEHFLGIGLKRFVTIHVQDNRAQTLEVDAFAGAVREAGGECDSIAAPRSYLVRRDTRRRFQSLLATRIAAWKPPLGAFVAIPDMTPRLVVDLGVKRGLRVPENLCLIAGYSEPMLCLHPVPSLTSVALSYEEVGYEAAAWLERLMGGERAGGERRLIAPRGVVARRSTDFIAIDDPVVTEALRFILSHSHHPLAVGEVAKAAQTSRRTLERRFQDALGRTIASEIRRLRLERAKRHLLDAELPVKTVARLAGFSSRQRLYEAFREEESGSPTGFRRARKSR